MRVMRIILAVVPTVVPSVTYNCYVSEEYDIESEEDDNSCSSSRSSALSNL